MHRPPLPPGESLVFIFRGWVDPRAHGSVGIHEKNPGTPRLVAQCLNHCATPGPTVLLYSYILETDHFSSWYNVGAILLLQFIVHALLFPLLNALHCYITTFLSMCAASSMVCSCNSSISHFSSVFLTYFLNEFYMVPVVPLISGITFVFFFQHAL